MTPEKQNTQSEMAQAVKTLEAAGWQPEAMDQDFYSAGAGRCRATLKQLALQVQCHILGPSWEAILQALKARPLTITPGTCTQCHRTVNEMLLHMGWDVLCSNCVRELQPTVLKWRCLAAMGDRGAAETPLPPVPVDARHASAPPGMKCSDCTIDGEACPTCYASAWKQRHPHTHQV